MFGKLKSEIKELKIATWLNTRNNTGLFRKLEKEPLLTFDLYYNRESHMIEGLVYKNRGEKTSIDFKMSVDKIEINTYTSYDLDILRQFYTEEELCNY